MTTLKDDIALVRKACNEGDLYETFARARAVDTVYNPFRRICDAAEKSLPKTVKKWAVECDYTYPNGTVLKYRHGSEHTWAPYQTRDKAAKFAASLLADASGYSSVSVIEVEVDDK